MVPPSQANGLPEQCLFRPMVHRLQPDPCAHGPHHRSNSSQQVQHREIRRTPAITLLHIVGRIGKERMEVIVMNDGPDVLDLKIFLVCLQVFEFDDIQQIQNGEDQGVSVGQVAGDQ